MEKQSLANVLARYDIGPKTSNNPNAVKWKIQDGQLTVHHLTQEAGCRLVVSTPLELEDAEFGVYDPGKLQKMLQALDSNIEMRIVKHIMYLQDATTTAQFILSPLDIIFTEQYKDPEHDRPFKEIPHPNVEFVLTKEFRQRFVKAKSALPEATLFSVSASSLGSDNSVEFVINYSQHQTNQIKMTMPATINADLDLVAFSADFLGEIFSVNSDFESGKIVIFSKMVNDPNRGQRLAAGMDIDFSYANGSETKYRLTKVEII